MISTPGHWSQWNRHRSFRPYDVPETAFWFSPRHRVSLASGDVSSWVTEDEVFTAAQVSGQRPAFDATGVNGKEAITFTAANSDNLRSTTQNLLADGAARYVLAVGQLSSAGGGCLLRFKVGSPSCLLYIFKPDGNCYYYGDGSVEAHELNAGSPDFTVPFLIEWELTVGALPVVRVNGVARTIVGSNVTTDSGTTGFTIGGADVAGQYYPGSIADIYCASGIPSASDKAKLRTFFRLANRISL